MELRYFAAVIWCAYLQLKGVICEENKCLKNEIYGEREGNVYYCPNANSEYTECCEKDQEFTCCQKDSEKNLSEQFMLWGTVAGVVILMVVIGICVKKDINCCKSDRWIFYKYTSKGKKEQKKAMVGMEEDQRVYQPNYKDNSGFVYDGQVERH